MSNDDIKIQTAEPSFLQNNWFYLFVPIAAIFIIVEANGFPITMVLVIILIVILLTAIGKAWEWSRPWITFFVCALILGSGFSELSKHFLLPIPEINIEQTTIFVEAPTNIEDPDLRNYEIAKMGFEENWFVKTIGGMYGILAGAYIISLLIQIGASKNKKFFILEHWSLDAIVFAVGALSLIWAFKPNYAPDPATAQAANIAFLIALVGPLLWSLLMQVLSKGITLANQSEEKVNNQYYSYFIGIATYPLIAGLFSIFDLDLVDSYIMSDKLVKTAMTIQRWEEIKILGKFCGMFGPPAVVWAFTTLTFILGWRPKDSDN